MSSPTGAKADAGAEGALEQSSGNGDALGLIDILGIVHFWITEAIETRVAPVKGMVPMVTTCLWLWPEEAGRLRICVPDEPWLWDCESFELLSLSSLSSVPSSSGSGSPAASLPATNFPAEPAPLPTPAPTVATPASSYDACCFIPPLSVF